MISLMDKKGFSRFDVKKILLEKNAGRKSKPEISKHGNKCSFIFITNNLCDNGQIQLQFVNKGFKISTIKIQLCLVLFGLFKINFLFK